MEKTILVEIKPQKETELPKRPDKSKRYIGEAMTYVKNMNKWEAANEYMQRIVDGNFRYGQRKLYTA